MTPAKRPRGRPLALPTQPTSIRFNEAQREFYFDKGGAAWIKSLINLAMKKQKGKP